MNELCGQWAGRQKGRSPNGQYRLEVRRKQERHLSLHFPITTQVKHRLPFFLSCCWRLNCFPISPLPQHPQLVHISSQASCGHFECLGMEYDFWIFMQQCCQSLVFAWLASLTTQRRLLLPPFGFLFSSQATLHSMACRGCCLTHPPSAQFSQLSTP